MKVKDLIAELQKIENKEQVVLGFWTPEQEYFPLTDVCEHSTGSPVLRDLCGLSGLPVEIKVTVIHIDGGE